MIQACTGVFSAGVLSSVGMADNLPSLHILAASEQTFISQFVIIPTIYYPVFFAVTGAVQGLSVQETVDRAKDTFLPLMQRNLAFWVPVQFLAFAFVEENLQIPILIACGLVWTIILSAFAGAAKDPAADEDQLVVTMAAAEGPGNVFATEKTALGVGELSANKRRELESRDAATAADEESTSELLK